MDNDLERSVRLLEDALDTPTKGLFKLPAGTPKTNNMNLSISLPSDSIRELYNEPNSAMFHDTMSILMDGDKSIAGTIIQGGTPWKNTVNNLYTEFAEVMQRCHGGIDVLEAAEDLARCCSDALVVIKSLKSKVTVSTLPEEKWLEQERNNWRLLYVLYTDRMHSQDATKGDDIFDFGSSEVKCVNELFKRENLVRESQLVIDWLERNSLEEDTPILHDWTYGWENTLHQLLVPDSIAIGSTVDVVKDLHPDAPVAQGLSLHHLDNDGDKKLCQRIFTEIRCGNLEGAQELCYNSGHPWRAAMLEGWKLYHNPNEGATTDEMDTDIKKYKDIEGNSKRDLWKSCAIEFCKQHELNLYEKAAVGSLCGYLQGVLPVCNSWEDYLWIYLKTMIDIKVESEIRDSIIKSYKPLPENYWEQRLSLDEIFAILQSSENLTVAAESQESDHVIQKHVILDTVHELMILLEEWSENPQVSTQSLRFFAHLILFFENIGDTTNHKVCEKIIEAYISRLSDMNETQLVAFYVSKLSKRKQIKIYAKHCEKILIHNQRQDALVYAEDYSLNVFEITKAIVEGISNRPSDASSITHLQGKVTEIDEVKISSLDWLLFYEQQRPEALSYTNILIFKFITMGKVEAAQLAINKIPHDSVAKIKADEMVSEEIDQTIKDYLSFKAYLDAQEAFNEWFRQFRNKPTPPADLPETAHFTEKVAHKHRVSQFNAETERWKLTTSHSAKAAKTLLYNVLLFPQGWLVGAIDEEFLRAKCIPEITLLLYAVLSESGAHEEAVQLADLVATDKYGLYKVYSKEKLGELLEKICESSVALLNAKKDPFGNPHSA